MPACGSSGEARPAWLAAGNNLDAIYKHMHVSRARSFCSFLPSIRHYKTKPAPQESKLLLENRGSQCSAFSSASSHRTVPAVTATLLQSLKPAGLQTGREGTRSQLQRNQNHFAAGMLQIAQTFREGAHCTRFLKELFVHSLS